MRKVDDAMTALCGGLSDLGCVFHTEASASTRTNYVLVRKPIQAKIRVSDHPSHKFDKGAKRSRMLELDVSTSGRGATWQDALKQMREALNAPHTP